MNIANLTRSVKTNQRVRYAVWSFIGGLWLLNVHYSMAQLRAQAPSSSWVDELCYFVIAGGISAFCFLGMGILTNGFVARWLTSFVGQQVKSAKSPVEVAVVLTVTAVIVGVLLYALFQFYAWDMLTTRYGLRLTQFPLFSTASVPAWLLVAGPDLGCTALNISSQVDDLIKGAKPAGATPKQAGGGGSPLDRFL